MTNEEIKKIVDDERVEQLTVQASHHWEIATQRLEELTNELDAKVDTCVEVEIYAAQMRMQSAVMALVELNKIPCAYLFSEYNYLQNFSIVCLNASMSSAWSQSRSWMLPCLSMIL